MDLGLAGKRALVTGGSRGIGKAIARTLAREGADVAILARDSARLAAAAAEIAAESGRTTVPVVADTTDDRQVDAAVDAATRALGGIDILVAAAAEPGGYAAPPKLAQIEAGLFHREMDTKVMGYLRAARAVAPQMRAQRWGRMIFISGLAARLTGNAVGSMRNVAVAALAKNLADELGADGINVNVVHPGVTRTERTATLVDAQARMLSVEAREVEQRMVDGNSIRRLVDAAEVADVVAFLASPRAIAINGESIGAGGGVPRSIHY